MSWYDDGLARASPTLVRNRPQFSGQSVSMGSFHHHDLVRPPDLFLGEWHFRIVVQSCGINIHCGMSREHCPLTHRNTSFVPFSPASRSDTTAFSGTSRRKQIPCSRKSAVPCKLANTACMVLTTMPATRSSGVLPVSPNQSGRLTSIQLQALHAATTMF